MGFSWVTNHGLRLGYSEVLLIFCPLQWALVVVATLSSIFVYALDNTIVADVTPAAVNSLGDALKLPWLGVGWVDNGSCSVHILQVTCT